MSYLDRIEACHRWRPEYVRPCWLEGDRTPRGWVVHSFADRLRDFPKVFQVSDTAVVLQACYDAFESRSSVLEEVLRVLYAAGVIPKWRGEDYGIARRWGEAPLFRMERGAVPLFGVPAFGVHVNGYVATADGPRLWVGRRAKHKRVAPGKLDPLVAGGPPHGLRLMGKVGQEAPGEGGSPAELP